MAEEFTLQEALFFSCKRRRLSTMKIVLILIGAAWVVCATVEAGKGKACKSVWFLVYTHHVRVIFNWFSKEILYCINFFLHYSPQLVQESRATLNQSNLSFVLLCALWGARHVWFQHQGLLEPRLSLNTCDWKLLRVTWPDSSGPVRYLPSTFELWTRQFQVVELPRRFFPSCSKVLTYVL